MIEASENVELVSLRRQADLDASRAQGMEATTDVQAVEAVAGVSSASTGTLVREDEGEPVREAAPGDGVIVWDIWVLAALGVAVLWILICRFRRRENSA